MFYRFKNYYEASNACWNWIVTLNLLIPIFELWTALGDMQKHFRIMKCWLNKGRNFKNPTNLISNKKISIVSFYSLHSLKSYHSLFIFFWGWIIFFCVTTMMRGGLNKWNGNIYVCICCLKDYEINEMKNIFPHIFIIFFILHQHNRWRNMSDVGRRLHCDVKILIFKKEFTLNLCLMIRHVNRVKILIIWNWKVNRIWKVGTNFKKISIISHITYMYFHKIIKWNHTKVSELFESLSADREFIYSFWKVKSEVTKNTHGVLFEMKTK